MLAKHSVGGESFIVFLGSLSCTITIVDGKGALAKSLMGFIKQLITLGFNFVCSSHVIISCSGLPFGLCLMCNGFSQASSNKVDR